MDDVACYRVRLGQLDRLPDERWQRLHAEKPAQRLIAPQLLVSEAEDPQRERQQDDP